MHLPTPAPTSTPDSQVYMRLQQLVEARMRHQIRSLTLALHPTLALTLTLTLTLCLTLTLTLILTLTLTLT